MMRWFRRPPPPPPEFLTIDWQGYSYTAPNDVAQGYHVQESTPKMEKLVDCIPAGAERILDLGGNVGLFSLMAAVRHPNAEIICYEADPKLAGLATENLSPFPNVQVVPKAVDRDGCDLKFYRSEKSNQVGSVHRDAVLVFDENPIEIVVPSVPIAEVLRDGADFLKVDIQGAEWSVFEGVDLTNVRAAVFEVTFLDNGAIELAEYLRRQFANYRAINPVHSGADVLFTR